MHLLILLRREGKGIVWVSFYQNQFLHLIGMRIALHHLCSESWKSSQQGKVEFHERKFEPIISLSPQRCLLY